MNNNFSKFCVNIFYSSFAAKQTKIKYHQQKSLCRFTVVFRTSKGPFTLSVSINCCDVVCDISLIKLLRFLVKPSESLQKWVATPTDQI